MGFTQSTGNRTATTSTQLHLSLKNWTLTSIQSCCSGMIVKRSITASNHQCITARSGANQTPAEGMYDVYESEMNNQPLYGASTQVRIRNGQIIPKKRRNQRQRRDLL